MHAEVVGFSCPLIFHYFFFFLFFVEVFALQAGYSLLSGALEKKKVTNRVNFAIVTLLSFK